MNESDDLSGEHHDHDHHEHGSALPDVALRVRALETVLIEKGLVDPAALDKIVETYAHRVGPQNGAKVVARAWLDSAFRERLLADGSAAIAELGFGGRGGEHLTVVANGPDQHNLVVCTLCSCYPWPVLGLPPVWYKSAPYRSRAVMDPRGVLRDFGITLSPTTAIRVWDSTSEMRYMVLPVRPLDTDGLDENGLAALVTRDSMIGTGFPLAPTASA